MGLVGRAIEWMGEHKLATGAIGVGLGYLFVSRAASAAQSGVAPLPNGGVAQKLPSGHVVVVPPPGAHATGQAYYVTTVDPAPGGDLNARSSGAHDALGNPLGEIIGQWPKNGPVELLDPGDGVFIYVRGPGRDANGNAANLEGWAAAKFLQKRDPVKTAEDFLGVSLPVQF